MKKGFWVTVILSSLVVLFAFFFFVVWRPTLTHQKVEEGNGSTVKIDQKIVGKVDKKEENKPLEPAVAINNFIQDAEMPNGLEFEPFFKKEEQKIKDAFLEKFSSLIGKQALTQTNPELDSNLLDKTEQTEQLFDQNSATGTPKRVLTDEEWFKIAYPDYYLAYLQLLQNLMVERGFLAASEKVEFKGEKDINLFLHKAIDFALKENIYDQQQAINARYGLDVVLPVLREKERTQWNKTLSILILEALKIKTAWAQTSGDCYREGSSSGTGSNLWAMCCNCGWGTYGEEIIYYSDCGSLSSVTCDIYEMGCENSVCESSKPMILDPASMICGCG